MGANRRARRAHARPTGRSSVAVARFPFVPLATVPFAGEGMRVYTAPPRATARDLAALGTWVTAHSAPAPRCLAWRSRVERVLQHAIPLLLPHTGAVKRQVVPFVDPEGTVWLALGREASTEPLLVRLCTGTGARALGLVPCGTCAACAGTVEPVRSAPS